MTDYTLKPLGAGLVALRSMKDYKYVHTPDHLLMTHFFSSLNIIQKIYIYIFWIIYREEKFGA